MRHEGLYNLRFIVVRDQARMMQPRVYETNELAVGSKLARLLH